MEYNLRIGWIDHNVFRGGWGYVAPAGLGGYGDHAGLIIKTQRKYGKPQEDNARTSAGVQTPWGI